VAERRPLALPLSPSPFLGLRLVLTSSAVVAVPGRIREHDAPEGDKNDTGRKLGSGE